jgi:hypothetical protein
MILSYMEHPFNCGISPIQSFKIHDLVNKLLFRVWYIPASRRHAAVYNFTCRPALKQFA